MSSTLPDQTMVHDRLQSLHSMALLLTHDPLSPKANTVYCVHVLNLRA